MREGEGCVREGMCERVCVRGCVCVRKREGGVFEGGRGGVGEGCVGGGCEGGGVCG